MILKNTIIYLIGIPAVGKYTTAKEIVRITGATLVDSQVINTPIYTVVEYDGTDAFPFPKGAAEYVEKIHKAVVDVIRNYCRPDQSFVFTNVLDANVPGDRDWYDRTERLAKDRQAAFFPIWLTCDEEVIRQRKSGADRRARLKDIDLTNIHRWVHEFESLKVDHPNALTLDTTHSDPTQTAKRIIDHMKRTEDDKN